MNTNATSLDRLHDIIVPALVPWWPPAPGWYWVMAFAVILVASLALRAFIHWQHNRYRREALAELGRMEGRWKNASERTTMLLALAELLKRTALSAFPREEVASITGAKWFEFLDRAANTTAFSKGLGAMLENAIYDPRRSAALDEQKIQELTAAIRHWIRDHRADFEQKNAKKAKGKSDDRPWRPSLPSVQEN